MDINQDSQELPPVSGADATVQPPVQPVLKTPSQDPATSVPVAESLKVEAVAPPAVETKVQAVEEEKSTHVDRPAVATKVQEVAETTPLPPFGPGSKFKLDTGGSVKISAG